MKYIAPERNLKSFTCPHCGVLARQYQNSVSDKGLGGNSMYTAGDWLASSICEHCGEATLWLDEKMIFPNRGNAPLPNPDMPDDVMADYQEAAAIANMSPKAAAALLRLAIQKLCIHLGGKGKNINEDIGSLVKGGLSPIVQQSLDVVRVIGNNAVHPGQIDTDNVEAVSHLFQLVNLITDTMISAPAQVKALYDSLPASALDSIAKRDGSA
jgi:hypothetical protein